MDGTGAPIELCNSMKFYEVTKYWLDHPWYPGGVPGIYVNLNSWNRLPKRLQDLMTSTLVQMEPEIVQFHMADDAHKRQEIVDSKKMQFIQFSPDDTKRFVTLANDSMWKYMETLGCKPETIAKLKTFCKQ